MFFIDINLFFLWNLQDYFVDRVRQAAFNQGKKDLKRDVYVSQKRQRFYTNVYACASCSMMIIPRGKVLVEINKLSTQTCINQGVFEMKNKLYDKAVKNFTMAIRESREHALPFILRSRCLTL